MTIYFLIRCFFAVRHSKNNYCFSIILKEHAAEPFTKKPRIALKSSSAGLFTYNVKILVLFHIFLLFIPILSNVIIYVHQQTKVKKGIHYIFVTCQRIISSCSP